mmetsp:Transcript_115395/g.360927  ORF Transcript_115395/g.360927 Transcript_115395/m.360927 type:complete len:225 (-) Transcript_115395:359-1033(-)
MACCWSCSWKRRPSSTSFWRLSCARRSSLPREEALDEERRRRPRSRSRSRLLCFSFLDRLASSDDSPRELPEAWRLRPRPLRCSSAAAAAACRSQACCSSSAASIWARSQPSSWRCHLWMASHSWARRIATWRSRSRRAWSSASSASRWRSSKVLAFDRTKSRHRAIISSMRVAASSTLAPPCLEAAASSASSAGSSSLRSSTENCRASADSSLRKRCCFSEKR